MKLKIWKRQLTMLYGGYKREKLNARKMQILSLLDEEISSEDKKELEKELSELIIQLAKIK